MTYLPSIRPDAAPASCRLRRGDFGVEVRQASSLPLKLALFDGRSGLIALLDPVISKPTWTAVVFDHAGFGEAMKHLFEDRWQRAAQFGE